MDYVEFPAFVCMKIKRLRQVIIGSCVSPIYDNAKLCAILVKLFYAISIPPRPPVPPTNIKKVRVVVTHNRLLKVIENKEM